MAGRERVRKQELKLVDAIGGATRAVALASNILLAGVGFRVVAMRLSSRARPTIIGQSPPLTGIVERITLVGSRAYSEIRDLAVAGNVVYIATTNGLYLVDAKNPRQPAILGRYVTRLDPTATRKGVDCLAVAGPLAYLCVHNRLRVVDVSDPIKPVLLGSVHTGCFGDFKKVIVAETLAYVVAWDKVSVVDVSDPTHPVEIASHCLDDRDDWAITTVLSYDRLYVVCGNNGLLAFSLAAKE